MSEEATQQEQPRRYKAIVVDTLNALQNDTYIEHMKTKGTPTFNDWKDYGVEILDLFMHCKNSNCDIILILGREGSGKTIGAYYLDPESTLYLNPDNKPLTFPKANQMYSADKKNYKIPKDYDSVKALITAATKPERIHEEAKGRMTVFMLAHIDEFKSGNSERERMRVLGKMATKLNLEGGTIHSYYTWVDPDTSKEEGERYKFLTKNTGANTGRSPMGMWEEMKIPNNFQIILDKIISER